MQWRLRRGIVALAVASTLAISVTAVAAESGAPAAVAATDDARMALAREVVSLSGAGDLARRMLGQSKPFFLAQVRSTGALSEVDAERLWTLFVEEYDGRMPDFLDNIARTYADVLSEAQLADWRVFLGTETGRALAAHQLEFAIAGQQAGAAIGAAAEMRARQRLQEEKDRGAKP